MVLCQKAEWCCGDMHHNFDMYVSQLQCPGTLQHNTVNSYCLVWMPTCLTLFHTHIFRHAKVEFLRRLTTTHTNTHAHIHTHTHTYTHTHTHTYTHTHKHTHTYTHTHTHTHIHDQWLTAEQLTCFSNGIFHKFKRSCLESKGHSCKHSVLAKEGAVLWGVLNHIQNLLLCKCRRCGMEVELHDPSRAHK